MKKLVAVIAFETVALNLAWELSQAMFYTCSKDPVRCFWLCLRASLGDVVIVAGLYGIIALLFRDRRWFARFSWAKLMSLMIVGGIIAIGIEKYALAVHRWEYLPSMPLIPGLAVGVWPVLQMILIPPLIWLSMWWFKPAKLT